MRDEVICLNETRRNKEAAASTNKKKSYVPDSGSVNNTAHVGNRWSHVLVQIVLDAHQVEETNR